METAALIAKALALGMVQVPEEISALADFLKRHQPNHILEIGSETGGTFYLWCRLAAAGGLKISLDLPSGNSGSGRFRDQNALAARTTEFKRWSANVHIVTGDSHTQKSHREVEAILDGKKLDFLFIDGDHSYEGVKADWEDYKGFVRPGGFVAFHDILNSDVHHYRGCFVDILWRELRGDKVEFCAEGMHWGGIGVIRV